MATLSGSLINWSVRTTTSLIHATSNAPSACISILINTLPFGSNIASPVFVEWSAQTYRFISPPSLTLRWHTGKAASCFVIDELYLHLKVSDYPLISFRTSMFFGPPFLVDFDQPRSTKTLTICQPSLS